MISDTDDILTDTDDILTDTDDILTDTDKILTDTDKILTDTDDILTYTDAILTDTDAILTDTDEILTDTDDILTEVFVKSISCCTDCIHLNDCVLVPWQRHFGLVMYGSTYPVAVANQSLCLQTTWTEMSIDHTQRCLETTEI